MRTMPLEEDTRALINNTLINLGWNWNGINQNVYFERTKTKEEQQKLNGKRPDYVLYPKNSNKPLIVIEAKRKGARIDAALEQGIEYAKAIGAPLVFATDGVFCKSFHTIDNCTPILNGEELDEFIREALAIKFLNNHEVNTVSPKVQYDRKELIRIFDETNNLLRGEGLRAGIDRFGEFANILFLKLISETEQIKIESGERTRFDSCCHWNVIREIPLQVRIEYINNTVYKRLNSLYNTEIFTPLSIRNENILSEIMDKLDPLVLTDVDSDVKGDAFEYFLRASTATKNDLGEYFTPRHIVKTMVRLVNPQIGEKIYDPFCGTGGFLIESFRYIYNNMARTETNMETLRNKTVYGNEITNTARITKMNMILAGDGHSNIQMKDSLSKPIDGNTIHNGFDIVITNMPYSQKTQYGYLYDIPSKNGDSICVQHCIKAVNSMAENGRMALVVPEGFLFRKDLSKTREYLLERCQLQSIISLPQGVFLPYTGVKTDIIYATKVNQKIKSSEKKKDFWYFDVKSDGYTLDNHRRKLDTPSDLNKYEEYRKLDSEQKEEMLKFGFNMISIDKVYENSYILVGSRYSKNRNIKKENKWEIVKLEELFDFVSDCINPKNEEGEVFCIGLENIEPETGRIIGDIICDIETIKSAKRVFRRKDILFGKLRPNLNKITTVDFDGVCSTDIIVLRARNKDILPELYSFILRSKYFNDMVINGINGCQLPRVDVKYLLDLPIYKIPIKEQKEIYSEIIKYQEIILGAKRIIENYNFNIQVSTDFTIKSLTDFCSINEKTVDPKKEFGEKEFEYIDISSVCNGTGEIINKKIIKGNNAPSRAKRAFKKGDILLSTVRPNLKAFSYVDFEANDFVASTGFAVLTPKNINGKYLYYILFSKFMEEQFESVMSKGMYPSINKLDLQNLNIPVPTIEEQEKIVKQIDEEQRLVNSSKKIIGLFTNKIENCIKKIYK